MTYCKTCKEYMHEMAPSFGGACWRCHMTEMMMALEDFAAGELDSSLANILYDDSDCRIDTIGIINKTRRRDNG